MEAPKRTDEGSILADLADTNLTLFFTAGTGLKDWDASGNLTREIEIYRRLRDRLESVNFITYGGNEDREYRNDLDGIEILPTRWYKLFGFPFTGLMENNISRSFGRQLMDTDVFKTNQISGSDIAMRLSRRYKKRLMVRCGFLKSEFIGRQTTNSRLIHRETLAEKEAFLQADVGIVSSQRDKETVVAKHGIDPGKMMVVPNYVITDVFKPLSDVKKSHDLVYVGRNAPQKNLESMLKAIQQVDKDLSILLVGGCCSDAGLKKRITEYGIKAEYAGNVANNDLPNYLNRAKAFILPSHYEGHPKALLEAMSCGMPCIGADVEGIREDITDGRTGLLCGTDAESMSDAIERMFSDEKKMGDMGKSAREYIIEKYSIDTVLELVTSHCDPTINLFDNYSLTRGEKVIGAWPIDLRGCSQ